VPSPRPAGRDAPLAAWSLPHGAHLALCLALCAGRGRQAVVQRDAPGGMLAGAIASGLEPHWLAPEIDTLAGVAHGVVPGALDAALAAAPGARAAVIVAPALHGAIPDVGALAAVAHGHGAALVADASHAADPRLPAALLAAGADLVVAAEVPPPGGPPALVGGVLLHGDETERWLPLAAVERAAALAGGHAAGDRDVPWTEDVTAVAAARERLTGAPGVRVLGPSLAGTPGVAAYDRLRLAVDVRQTGRDARAVARALAVPPAAASTRHLVAAPGTAGRFAAALLDTLWSVAPADLPAAPVSAAPPGPAACTPRAAWLAPREHVPPAAAVGRIAAEALTPCPPGVPAVLPGERLVPDVLATLRAAPAVHGADDGFATIAVVAERRR